MQKTNTVSAAMTKDAGELRQQIDQAQAQASEAQAQARELAASPALILTVAVNRISGAVTFANNIDQARIGQDIDQAIGALEVITREMRREQLRLAEERGKTGSNGHRPEGQKE